MSDQVSIVADIGGTNTRVALASGATIQRDTIKRFRNVEHSGVEPILDAYIKDMEAKPKAICIDLAGPVKAGIGTLTNLDWVVDKNKVAAETGAETVALLNDLQAMGYAVAHIDPDNLMEIVPGPEGHFDDARLVVNIGTGLNIAQVFRSRGHTLVPPAEAGHISFVAQTEEEIRLLQWLQGRYGTPGYEEALSGRGFERIYRFLSMEAGEEIDLKADVIFEAFQKGEPRALRAAQIFTTLAGRYTGNFALSTVPTGGIYLVGGVAAHFAPYFARLGFEEAFKDKGRFSGFLDQFAVHAVRDDYAALIGCAVHLSELDAG